jgi:hypothetical protein
MQDATNRIVVVGIGGEVSIVPWWRHGHRFDRTVTHNAQDVGLTKNSYIHPHNKELREKVGWKIPRQHPNCTQVKYCRNEL